MKKIVALLLVLSTFYLAGMYRNLPLMIVCGMELALMAVCIVMPFYYKKRLSVKFVVQSAVAQAGTDAVCRIRCVYTGQLPVSRFAVKVHAGFQPLEQVVSRTLYGGSEGGESELTFRVSVPYCGILSLSMEYVQVYDFFALFSLKKNIAEEMTIAVFPSEEALHLNLPCRVDEERNVPQEQTMRQIGEAHQEIRQIREYRDGDSTRHIHWNLSARTGALRIKEYEQETDFSATVLLDTRGFTGVPKDKESAFFTLLSAVVLGLLKSASTVQVVWEEETGIQSADIRGIKDCRELLLELYMIEFSQSEVEWEQESGNIFRINRRLELSVDNRLLFQFDEKELRRQIAETALIL